MSDNPFANPEADRYFSDESVKAATNKSSEPAPALAPAAPPTTAAVLDDYNPFAAENQPQKPPVQQSVAPTFVQSAPVVVTSNQPPNNQQQNSNVDTQELQRRQEELERKAAELMRKEQELKNMQIGVKTNNFPPIPDCCKIKPCFYQDINVEIPVEFQRLVRMAFYYWISLGGLLVWDLVLSLTLLIMGDGNGGVSFGICLVNFAVCIPLSYVCWFRPLYKAFRDDSSFNFFLFFIIFAVQLVIHGLMAVGIPGYVPGFFSGITLTSKTGMLAIGIVSITSGIFHGLVAAFDAFLLIKVHGIYRSSGASLQRAQAEFASGVMSNKGVQQAAASAAQSAAQAATQNAFSGGGTGQPGNRF